MFSFNAIFNSFVFYQVQVLVQRGKEDGQRRVQLAEVQAGQDRAEAALHLDPRRLATSQTLAPNQSWLVVIMKNQFTHSQIFTEENLDWMWSQIKLVTKMIFSWNFYNKLSSRSEVLLKTILKRRWLIQFSFVPKVVSRFLKFCQVNC